MLRLAQDLRSAALRLCSPVQVMAWGSCSPQCTCTLVLLVAAALMLPAAVTHAQTVSSIIAGQIAQQLAPGGEPVQAPGEIQTGAERDGKQSCKDCLAVCLLGC